jgi:hypothetical protein
VEIRPECGRAATTSARGLQAARLVGADAGAPGRWARPLTP